MWCYGEFLTLCQVILVFLGQPGRCRWIASRTDRDAKNARNEKRNEMNAKSEFAPGRSERWRHPEPEQRLPALGSGAGRQRRGLGGRRAAREVTPSGPRRGSEFTALKSTCSSIDLTTSSRGGRSTQTQHSCKSARTWQKGTLQSPFKFFTEKQAKIQKYSEIILQKIQQNMYFN